jgi:hypothetical protein
MDLMPLHFIILPLLPLKKKERLPRTEKTTTRKHEEREASSSLGKDCVFIDEIYSSSKLFNAFWNRPAWLFSAIANVLRDEGGMRVMIPRTNQQSHQILLLLLL